MSSAIYRDWLWEAYLRLENPPTVDDYQVRIPLDYLHGMNPDFSDIRFTDVYGRVLKYNRFSKVDGVSADIDVLVHNQDTGINIYYGNSVAKDASDGDNVYNGFDDFNRANNDSLGSSWTEGTPDFDILNNMLQCASAPAGAVHYNDFTGSNYKVSATFYDSDDGDFSDTDHRFGMSFYVQDETDAEYNSERYYLEILSFHSQIKLHKHVGTTWSQVGSTGFSKTFSHGDEVTIDTSTTGTGLKVYKNGTLWHTFSAGDSSWTSGYAGIGTTLNSGNVVAVDNFIIRKALTTEPVPSLVLITPNLSNYAYDTIIVAGVVYSDTITVNGDGTIFLSDIQDVLGTVSVAGDGTPAISDIATYTDIISQAGQGTVLLEDAATYSDTISVNGAGSIVSITFNATSAWHEVISITSIIYPDGIALTSTINQTIELSSIIEVIE